MMFIRNLFLKKSTLASIILMLGFSVGLSACSNNEKSQPNKVKTIQTLNQSQAVETGTVVSVRTIKIKPEQVNSYGNVGLSAGSRGFGGIFGSIDVVSLFRIFKNATTTQTAQEIIVTKANGQTVAITQIAKETFNRGDPVKILIRNGEVQVIH